MAESERQQGERDQPAAKDHGDEREDGHEDGGEHSKQEGREEIEALEKADEVPTDPREWPGGKAKYITFGGSEATSNEPYGEDVTGKLGPSDVHHRPDGGVEVRGEEVDSPEDYKGEPIPGGPTDPEAPDLAANRDAREEMKGRETGGEEGAGAKEQSDGERPEPAERQSGSGEDGGR